MTIVAGAQRIAVHQDGPAVVGSLVAVIGPPGAGKTTVISALARPRSLPVFRLSEAVLAYSDLLADFALSTDPLWWVAVQAVQRILPAAFVEGRFDIGQTIRIPHMLILNNEKVLPEFQGEPGKQESRMTTPQRPQPDLLTAREVAQMARVSRMTVYRLMHSGELAAVRVGRVLRVPREAVHRYLRGHTTDRFPTHTTPGEPGLGEVIPRADTDRGPRDERHP